MWSRHKRQPVQTPCLRSLCPCLLHDAHFPRRSEYRARGACTRAFFESNTCSETTTVSGPWLTVLISRESFFLFFGSLSQQEDRCAADVDRVTEAAGHELLCALCFIQDRLSLWFFRYIHWTILLWIYMLFPWARDRQRFHGLTSDALTVKQLSALSIAAWKDLLRDAWQCISCLQVEPHVLSVDVHLH